MSRGIAAATSHRRYGAIDYVPDVAIADPNIKAELEKLCEKIGNNLQLINKFTKKLERDVRNIGTARDNQNLRDSVQATRVDCNQLVKQTMGDLVIIGEKSRSADKQTKLQVERLRAAMETAVPTYGNIQKQIVDKTRQYILPQPVSPTEDQDQLLLREQEAAYNEQQRQLQTELEFEGGMLQNRLSRVKNVEVEVLDINDMMRMLASMVNDQAPMIDTIEQNTENTLVNIESAAQELNKAASHVGRRRRTVACLAFVAVVVLIIVIVLLFIK